MVPPAGAAGQSGQLAQELGRYLLAKHLAVRRPLLNPQLADLDTPGLIGSGKCVLKSFGSDQDHGALPVVGGSDDFGLISGDELFKTPTGEDALSLGQRLFSSEVAVHERLESPVGAAIHDRSRSVVTRCHEELDDDAHRGMVPARPTLVHPPSARRLRSAKPRPPPIEATMITIYGWSITDLVDVMSQRADR